MYTTLFIKITQKVFLFIFLLMLCLDVLAKPVYVRISTQKGFDGLSAKIEQLVEAGNDDVVIQFVKGVYFYNESHLSIKKSNPSLSLTIDGNGSTFRGKIQSPQSKSLEPKYTYFENDEVAYPWSDIVQTTTLVQVIDEGRKLCRIKGKQTLKVSAGDYIQISTWFRTKIYVVSKILNDYIYFIADDLTFKDSYNGWNINYDYLYGGEMPRYRILNSINSDLECSTVTNFMSLDKIAIKSLNISDIIFEGCAFDEWKGLIRLNDIAANTIGFKNCKFEGSQSLCINISNTNNVCIENCLFENNYSQCIKDDQKCKNLIIRNNRFYNNNRQWQNLMNVNCSSENFSIDGNVFVNFDYGAIGVGVWYANKKEKGHKVSGIIEKNEIYYTRDFFLNYKRHTLMDSGAIYTWTKNDNVIIRNNYIHDITGMKDNRGIFCDDGSCNVKIYGNIIINTPNSYSIDLRAEPITEKDPRYDFGRVNVGNEIYGNIVDGIVRFEGRKGNSNNFCKKGTNYILHKGDIGGQKQIISSVKVIGEDRWIMYSALYRDAYILNMFKQNPYYKHLISRANSQNLQENNNKEDKVNVGKCIY